MGALVIKREPDEPKVVKLRHGSLSSNDSAQASLVAFWKPPCARCHRQYPNNRARLDLPPGVIDGEQPRKCSDTRFIGHRVIPPESTKADQCNRLLMADLSLAFEEQPYSHRPECTCVPSSSCWSIRLVIALSRDDIDRATVQRAADARGAGASPDGRTARPGRRITRADECFLDGQAARSQTETSRSRRQYWCSEADQCPPQGEGCRPDTEISRSPRQISRSLGQISIGEGHRWPSGWEISPSEGEVAPRNGNFAKGRRTSERRRLPEATLRTQAGCQCDAAT